MISEFDVEMTYKYLLGRAPENRAVVMEKAGAHNSVDELRRTLFLSEEFKYKLAQVTQPASPGGVSGPA